MPPLSGVALGAELWGAAGLSQTRSGVRNLMLEDIVIEAEPGWSAPPTAGVTVDVAVVMPIYKHPGLFPEAIAAVLAQRGGLEIRIVLVDDGCPMPETAAVASAYAAEFPGRIIHLRRANGGLSAARNTGIDFALAAWPDLKSVYLLDADNRIGPYFLKRSLDLLLESPPEIGWIYPDINNFGFTGNYDTAGDYALYFHLWDNYCEAGSLIRREVLDRGIRFDETMRLGFEDWEFWLQAAEAGFRGRHIAEVGFQYRRRAESMLTDSERDRGEILAGMRRKHKALHQPRSLLALEQADAPRYALITETGPALLTTDPYAPGQRLANAACWRRYLESITSGGRVQFPSFIVFTTETCLTVLRETGLLRWLLWRAESLLDNAHVVTASIGKAWAEHERSYEEVTGPDARLRLPGSMFMMVSSSIFTAAVQDASTDWIASLTGPNPQPNVAALEIRVPPRRLRNRPDLFATRGSFLVSELEKIRQIHHEGVVVRPFWREFALMPRTRSHQLAREIANTGPLWPVVPTPGQLDIGFMLPLAAFGGVEKVAANYAAVARKRGWRPHLFVFNTKSASIFPEFEGVFESISFLGDETVSQWQDRKAYFGVSPTSWAVGDAHAAALGLLSSMSILFNIQSNDAHALMARLRRHGVKTVGNLHLVERDRHGRPIGQPHMLLPYEHAYDLITMPSVDLRDVLAGFGVPADKLVVIPNAPSYESAPKAVATAMAARARRPVDSPLRIAFAGRLDHQKGLERLVEIYRRTSLMPDRFQWRIVGKRLVEQGAKADLAGIDAVIEPPIFDSAELDQVYAWADVLLLPSRFEGVPLTILEAARMGCVSCATDVGAVREIIYDQVDGILIDERGTDDEVAGRCLAALVDLQRDRLRLLTMSRAAASRAGQLTWDNTMSDFMRSIDVLLAGAAK
jgi:glycosyltransferase involved in cell wall biosynthesis